MCFKCRCLRIRQVIVIIRICPRSRRMRWSNYSSTKPNTNHYSITGRFLRLHVDTWIWVMKGRLLLIHLLQRIRLNHLLQWIPLTGRDVHSVLELILLASRIHSIRTTKYFHSVASRTYIFYLVICVVSFGICFYL